MPPTTARSSSPELVTATTKMAMEAMSRVVAVVAGELGTDVMTDLVMAVMTDLVTEVMT